MDLEIAGRTAVVGVGALAAGLTKALQDEGVRVVTELTDQVDIVVSHPPSPHDLLFLDVTSAQELHDAWDSVVDTVASYRTALPGMVTRGWGRCIWIGSSTAKSLNTDQDDLGAVVSLAVMAANKVISAECGSSGITANAVLRGGSATTEDVSSAVAFLCSEGASYLTGVTIVVDGGAGMAMF
jgi:NAD(P)-dependent dehydrogenase (short-subunit alcohol dehydrogenase family)